VSGPPIGYAATSRSRSTSANAGSSSSRTATIAPWLCPATTIGRPASYWSSQKRNAATTSSPASAIARAPSPLGVANGFMLACR
jgi:hypothetical protein